MEFLIGIADVVVPRHGVDELGIELLAVLGSVIVLALYRVFRGRKRPPL